MKRHPLEDLGWALLPENVLRAKLANHIIRNLGIDSLDGNLTQIKDAVRDTHPPYGFLQRRYNAMLREIPRQADIISRRTRMAGVVDETLVPKQERLCDRKTRIVRRIIGTDMGYISHSEISRFGPCQVVFVRSSSISGIFIRKDGVLHRWHRPRYKSFDSLAAALIGVLVSDAAGIFKIGASMRLDFDALETVVRYPCGQESYTSWMSVPSYIGIHTPARQEPELLLPPGKSRRARDE